MNDLHEVQRNHSVFEKPEHFVSGRDIKKRFIKMRNVLSIGKKHLREKGLLYLDIIYFVGSKAKSKTGISDIMREKAKLINR
jgi:hypothetical protein